MSLLEFLAMIVIMACVLVEYLFPALFYFIIISLGHRIKMIVLYAMMFHIDMSCIEVEDQRGIFGIIWRVSEV